MGIVHAVLTFLPFLCSTSCVFLVVLLHKINNDVYHMIIDQDGCLVLVCSSRIMDLAGEGL